MSMTYTTYTEQLANLMVISPTNAEFQLFVPGCIDYAEQRIYRELDLIQTQVTDVAVTTAGDRSLALPTSIGVYITADIINVVTPAGAGRATGTRHCLVPVDQSFLDIVYASQATDSGVPEYFSRYSDTHIILGPTPDAEYTVEVIGTQRPAPLTFFNPQTFITAYIPDIFIAASMVFASGYMRNFGAQSDNPQMAASWEDQYKLLVKSADVEQTRIKFAAEGWTSAQPSQLATPKRV